MKEKRGFWYLLTGLALGIGTGLLIAWVLAPIDYVNTTPASLRFDFKDEYRFMIALAYDANDDLLRAQARLGTVEDVEPLKALGEQAQRMLASNTEMDKVQILANLSEALRAQATAPSPTHTPAQTPASPSESINQTELPLQGSLTPITPASTLSTAQKPGLTLTVQDTATPPPTAVFTLAPRSTRTPTPTPGKPFVLSNQATSCEVSQPGLLQIDLRDGAGKPVAGIELIITWFGGEEHFFTGLKPDLGNGYADYALSTNVEYALSLSDGGTRVTGLIAPSCADLAGNTYPGSIQLEFEQP